MGKLLYGRVKALLFEMLSFERYWRERNLNQVAQFIEPKAHLAVFIEAIRSRIYWVYTINTFIHGGRPGIGKVFYVGN